MKTTSYTGAIQSIKTAILRSRYRAATLANSEMLMLYFSVGGYISQNSREGKWGTNAIAVIAQQLQKELPGLRGFGATNMRCMRLFFEAWSPFLNSAITTAELTSEIRQMHLTNLQQSENQQVASNRPLQRTKLLATDNQQTSNSSDASDELASEIHRLQPMNLQYVDNQSVTKKRQLSTDDLQLFFSIGFTHHCEIFTNVKDPTARLFYIQKCATEFWSVEKLKYHLKSDLYGKQGTLPTNFTKTISDTDLRQRALQSFKDEYLLDFINIEDPSDEPDERVLEHGIVANVQKFIMALGNDFSFIGNQYRMEVDEKEYFIDLLFFNRRLQSLVAFELKRGEFKPEYAGKLNFYLSALDDAVKLPHENPSIGIILCKSQRKTTVEFAFRDTSKPMGVATYRLASELPEPYRGILPDAKTLEKLL